MTSDAKHEANPEAASATDRPCDAQGPALGARTDCPSETGGVKSFILGADDYVIDYSLLRSA